MTGIQQAVSLQKATGLFADRSRPFLLPQAVSLQKATGLFADRSRPRNDVMWFGFAMIHHSDRRCKYCCLEYRNEKGCISGLFHEIQPFVIYLYCSMISRTFATFSSRSSLVVASQRNRRYGSVFEGLMLNHQSGNSTLYPSKSIEAVAFS